MTDNLFVSKEEAQRRAEHNKTINVLPEVLKDAVIHSDQCIIKLFAYEEVATTKSSKLITLQYKVGETAGGRTTSVVAQDTYQARGVILKLGVGEHSDRYNVGDVVWLNHRSLFASSFDLLIDRNVPVQEPCGIVLLPTSNIQLVEKSAKVTTDSSEAVDYDAYPEHKDIVYTDLISGEEVKFEDLIGGETYFRSIKGKEKNRITFTERLLNSLKPVPKPLISEILEAAALSEANKKNAEDINYQKGSEI